MTHTTNKSYEKLSFPESDRNEGFFYFTRPDRLRNRTLSHQLSIKGVDPLTLYGHNDVNLLALEARYGVHVTARGETVTISGPAFKVRHVSGLLEEMVSCLRRGDIPEESDESCAVTVDNGPTDTHKTVLVTQKCVIRPRSAAQQQYVTGIEKFDIVFGIGPAGTGKTYLAVACAAAALKRKEVSRIILTRPAVEAGESLGFLPGDIQDKVDPYLRPLYDALRDMIPRRAYTTPARESDTGNRSPGIHARAHAQQRLCHPG